MNKEEQVELLSKVDIFESLPREEIKEILDDLLDRHAEINLSRGEVFYTSQEPDGKLFVLKKGRVRIYKMEGSDLATAAAARIRHAGGRDRTNAADAWSLDRRAPLP